MISPPMAIVAVTLGLVDEAVGDVQPVHRDREHGRLAEPGGGRHAVVVALDEDRPTRVLRAEPRGFGCIVVSGIEVLIIFAY